MTMTPLERVTAVLNGQLPDRVPACLFLLMQGARELEMSLEEYFTCAENTARGQLALFERYGHDCVFGTPHVVEDTTAFGTPLRYFHNGPPSIGDIVLRSYDDVLQLEAPDPANSPELVKTLRTIEILRAEVGGEVPIMGGAIAPFSLPSMLMGTERWMQLLLLEPESLREQVMPHLLGVMLEFATRWANMQLAAGADVIVLSDGMASASVINRRQFIDFAFDIVQETISRINGPVVHEGVGDLFPMLDLIVDAGALGAVLTANDDIARSKHDVGSELTLIGNLNNLTIRHWSFEETRTNAQRVLEAAAPGGRFILGTQGPEIPFDVEPAVLHALVDAAHDWEY